MSVFAIDAYAVWVLTETQMARFADANRWHAPGSSEPNDTEVLFLALLLVEAHHRRAQELQCWATAVADEAQRAAELGASWKPPESWGYQ